MENKLKVNIAQMIYIYCKNSSQYRMVDNFWRVLFLDTSKNITPTKIKFSET